MVVELFCFRPSIIPQIIVRILDFCMVLWNLQSLIPLPCCHIPQSIAKTSVLPLDLWNLSSHLPILFHRLVPEYLLSIIVCGILHIEKGVSKVIWGLIFPPTQCENSIISKVIWGLDLGADMKAKQKGAVALSKLV